MLSVLWDPPSASHVPFNTEPSAYEIHCHKQRELRELERQVDRFGADAMKVDPRLALDAPLPPEELFGYIAEFVRLLAATVPPP